MTTRFRAAWWLVVVALLLPRAASAQAAGAGSGGAVRLLEEQRLAGNWRRVLMIGAHPDDEDTELLTILSRGEGIRTAYLSLTRGDGGQNLIGQELGPALGVLRTEELLAARRVDGGEQFFTRAFDFGFSKTVEEAFRFWPHDSLLKDVVRIIRRFRPQVVISVWSGTPADGHGHHQASGVIALDAFHAAGDANRFPELASEEHLAPWQPAKFYRSTRGAPASSTLTFDGGTVDPALGLTYHQIAVVSRDQHRSQNQGRLEDLGPSRAGLALVERATTRQGSDDSLFAGIPLEPVPADDRHASEARLTRAGIVVDATTDDDEVVPGQRLPVTLRIYNGGADTAALQLDAVVAHEGYRIGEAACTRGPLRLAPRELINCVVSVTVDPRAVPDTPYFLRLPADGGMYRWSGPVAFWGLPFDPPLEAEFRISVGGGPAAHVTRDIVGRFLDPVLGEVRRPVTIVPPIAVTMTPDRLLWPVGTARRTFEVRLEHLARDTSDAQVELRLPSGWHTAGAQRVHFAEEGQQAVVRFTVVAPTLLRPGNYPVEALVISGADTLRSGLTRIRYPHVTPRNIVTRATTTVVVADVKFPSVGTIGYVRGGGDRTPEALRSAGLTVQLLTGDALERGSLAGFRVIVIGTRAYESDASLVRAQPRLMRWLADGGTLIVQYQQTPYVRGGFAPRPLEIGAPTQNRVTDETAPVMLLDPKAQAFQRPNRIGPADFDGWVQERGLDFPSSWDAAWTPLLEMHDAGDHPQRGGLLVARVGKGTAVYTGLAFHRQLPALVPGAWRLFANLLGLGQPPGTK